MELRHGFTFAAWSCCCAGVTSRTPHFPDVFFPVDCLLLFPTPAAGDIGLMNDLLKDLEDPETLKEVEKLMKVRAGAPSARAGGGVPKVRSSG